MYYNFDIKVKKVVILIFFNISKLTKMYVINIINCKKLKKKKKHILFFCVTRFLIVGYFTINFFVPSQCTLIFKYVHFHVNHFSA